VSDRPLASEANVMDAVMRRLDTTLNPLSQKVGQLAETVAELSASVNATSDRNRQELDVLFGQTRDLGARTGDIEKSYVPREDLQRIEDRNNAEHTEFRRDIVELIRQVSKYVGGAIVLTGLIQVIGQPLLQLLTRH